MTGIFEVSEESLSRCSVTKGAEHRTSEALCEIISDEAESKLPANRCAPFSAEVGPACCLTTATFTILKRRGVVSCPIRESLLTGANLEVTQSRNKT